MDKHCNKCSTWKRRSEFHRRRASADGLAAICKACQSEYDHARGGCLKRRAVREAYLQTPRGRAAANRAKRSYIGRNPKKRAAHIAVGNAIRDGKLRRKPCQECGKIEGVHAHHDDYSRPLDVIWLCTPHHRERHRLLADGRLP